MKIDFYCPAWGMLEEGFGPKFGRVAAAGYDGIEIYGNPSPDEARELLDCSEKYGLKVIGQILTGGMTPAEHIAFLQQAVDNWTAAKPVHVNVHLGKDFYLIKDKIQLARASVELAAAAGMTVLHETHRGRMTFSPQATREILAACPEFLLNADFSHWCCVCESYLEDQAEAVQLAIDNSRQIHCRVGHPEGPQVTHPAAPEWQEAVDVHLAWWDTIIELRTAAGDETLPITCEFGPVDYMPTLPFTNQPVADQWEVNKYMLQLLRERY